MQQDYQAKTREGEELSIMEVWGVKHMMVFRPDLACETTSSGPPGSQKCVCMVEGGVTWPAKKSRALDPGGHGH